MDVAQISGLILLGMALLAGGATAYTMFRAKHKVDYRNLMANPNQAAQGVSREMREKVRNDPDGKEFERLSKLAKNSKVHKQEVTLEEKFFRAGIFSTADKREFNRLRIIVPIVTVIAGAFGGAQAGGTYGILGMVMGLLGGLQLPFTILDRRIKGRDEEIMYFLPLVIEQIAIGVSSSLDIGPCIQRVVQMADERDTHNVVTELLQHAQYHVRSGASLEDALTEVGKRTGHNELKHAFMSLSQVAKHGGEITRQLQELADAVSGQRESRIEGKIKKLELEATFPVTLVFCGFLLILLIGFFVQIQGAF